MVWVLSFSKTVKNTGILLHIALEAAAAGSQQVTPDLVAVSVPFPHTVI